MVERRTLNPLVMGSIPILATNFQSPMSAFTIDVKVSSTIINDQAMELIRTEVRKKILFVVFKAIDDVAEANDFRFSHKDIVVDGIVKAAE